MRKIALLILAVLCLGGLSACGKKASHVDAPSGEENDTFPRVYPNPDLDPKP